MRRRCSEKRHINPDRKFNNVLFSKFINKVMLNGKKSIAERICYESVENGAKKQNVEPLAFFEKVIENVAPKKKVVLRRFGGNTYSVPKEIKVEERPLRAITIIVKTFRDLAFSQGKPCTVVLTELLNQSYENLGAAVSAKEKLHKTADLNQAFAHFSW